MWEIGFRDKVMLTMLVPAIISLPALLFLLDPISFIVSIICICLLSVGLIILILDEKDPYILRGPRPPPPKLPPTSRHESKQG